MIYSVLKDVTIDGHIHKAGTELDLDPKRMARLVMLGFLGEPDGSANRAVGLDKATKPSKRKSAKAKSAKAEEPAVEAPEEGKAEE